MITTHKNSYAAWIDIVAPSREEIKKIMDEYGIDPIIGDDLLLPLQKPKIYLHKDYIYLVLQFPSREHSHEVDFIIGKNYLITVRYEDSQAVELFSKFFEVDSILEKSSRKVGQEHAGFVLFTMLVRLYEGVWNELDFTRDTLRKTEADIFAGNQRETARALLFESRILNHFKQTIETHEEILASFGVAAAELFGDPFSYYANSVSASYQRLFKEIYSQREYIKELRETNDSILSTHQNESMRIFTMMAFFTFPLTLIVAIFTLPSKNVPIIGEPNDFYIIVALLAAVLLFMIWFFKRKRWL